MVEPGSYIARWSSNQLGGRPRAHMLVPCQCVCYCSKRNGSKNSPHLVESFQAWTSAVWPAWLGPILCDSLGHFIEHILSGLLLNVHGCATPACMVRQEVVDAIHCGVARACSCNGDLGTPLGRQSGCHKRLFFSALGKVEKFLGNCGPVFPLIRRGKLP